MNLPETDRTEFGFRRTVCACRDCVQACEHLPGYLVPADLPRMQAALAPQELFQDFALKYLEASPGSLIRHQDTTVRIPTLVPQSRPDGSCIFLSEGRCTIHAVAPYGCAFYSTHDSKVEGDRKTLVALEVICQDLDEGGDYSRAWSLLQRVRGLGRNVAEKRQAWLAAAEAELEQRSADNELAG